MNGRGEPRHQPIGMLPTIARIIDEGLTDTQEQYATLLEARPKPWVLDDALVNRSKHVNGEALEWCGVYDQTAQPLARPAPHARSTPRSDPPPRRSARPAPRPQRVLALLDELAANTIDRQLAKSDIQLGLEYLLGFGPPLPPRHPPT